MDLHAFLLLSDAVCILVTLFWTVIFFRKRRNSKAFAYASLFFSGITLIFLTMLANDIRWLYLSITLNFLFPFLITVVPFLYLYYLNYLTSDGQSAPRWGRYFFIIPTGMFVYSAYAFYLHYPLNDIWNNFYTILYGKTEEAKSFGMAFMAHWLTWQTTIVCLIFMIVVSLYFILRIMRNVPDELPQIRERLVIRFLILFSVMFVVCIATIIFYYKGNGTVFMRWFWSLGTGALGYLMNRENFYSYSRKPLWYKNKFGDNDLASRFSAYIRDKKQWQTPNLTLDDVATALGTNRTYISKAISNDLESTFVSIINHHRIVEAKRLMKTEGDLKIDIISTQCGFESYSAFYTAFRKENGLSPRKYRQRFRVKQGTDFDNPGLSNQQQKQP